MKRHRIGLVGTGGIAHSHVAGYRSILGDTVEISAGCDLDKDRVNAFCDKLYCFHFYCVLNYTPAPGVSLIFKKKYCVTC